MVEYIRSAVKYRNLTNLRHIEFKPFTPQGSNGILSLHLMTNMCYTCAKHSSNTNALMSRQMDGTWTNWVSTYPRVWIGGPAQLWGSLCCVQQHHCRENRDEGWETNIKNKHKMDGFQFDLPQFHRKTVWKLKTAWKLWNRICNQKIFSEGLRTVTTGGVWSRDIKLFVEQEQIFVQNSFWYFFPPIQALKSGQAPAVCICQTWYLFQSKDVFIHTVLDFRELNWLTWWSRIIKGQISELQQATAAAGFYNPNPQNVGNLWTQTEGNNLLLQFYKPIFYL